MKNIDRIFGFAIFLILLFCAPYFLDTNMHFVRLLFGLALGYILSRSYTGFAGSINRAYNNGSTKLMRAMLMMFVITAIADVGFLAFSNKITAFNLDINPINSGLLIGGILFGLGMSFSACCASGVLTDLATDLPRAGVTLIFFCLGVFLGFPFQSMKLATDSWFTSETGAKFAGGVYMPDLFKHDGLNGYLGAIGLTVLIAGIIAYFAFVYEKKRKNENTYHMIPSENSQDNGPEFEVENFSLKNSSTYWLLLEKPWTLKQGAVGMTMVFVLMMGITKGGWGASTPYGIWFGQALNRMGVSGAAIAEFTKKPAEMFTTPFLSNPITVQNIGIFLGAFLFILTSGLLRKTLKATSSLTIKSTIMYSIGGFAMGFGTRLSNGCNVGALYTPISHFSISGWIFLIVLILGGIIGNAISKKVYAN